MGLSNHRFCTGAPREGSLRVFCVGPTVCHRAPDQDSDGTEGASLRWPEPPVSWAVTPQRQPGESTAVPAPLAPASRGPRLTPFPDTWGLPTPVTFRKEEGPHLLTLGGGWGELLRAQGGRGPGGGEWVGRLEAGGWGREGWSPPRVGGGTSKYRMVTPSLPPCLCAPGKRNLPCFVESWWGGGGWRMSS